MKKRTHYHIARLSVENTNQAEIITKRKFLNKWAFYFGTILPDLTITQFIHPHFYEKSYDYVFNKLNRIENKPVMGIKDAIILGEMVHYLCDYCCFVHISGSIGKVSEHVLYERRIQKYVLDNYESLQTKITKNLKAYNNTGNILEQIENELADYSNITPSYDRDILKSVTISAIIYYGILLKQIKHSKNAMMFN